METADQTRRDLLAGTATKPACDFAALAEGQPEAVRPSVNSGPAIGANLIIFPVSKTGGHLEAAIPEHSDDAAHCCHGLSALKLHEETAEDRATYRKWAFGMVAFYATLVLIAGAVAIASDSSTGPTGGTTPSAQRTIGFPRSN